MSQIKVGCLTLGMLENNTYFLHKEGEYDCIIIDPARDGEMLVTKLREKGLTIKAIFLTHAHFDHILGVPGIKKLCDVPIYGGKDDVEGFLDPSVNQSVKINKQISLKLDYELEDGDEITVSGMTCKVIATPGHTPGGVCFYFEEDNILFSGDTLFYETYGRTDFENGSAGDMQRSVQKLLLLPEETKVYPGHNDFTTIEHERKYNPLSVNY